MARTLLPFEPALASEKAFSALLSSVKAPRPLPTPAPQAAAPVSHNPFFDSMRIPVLNVHAATTSPTSATANLMLTENLGVTNASTLSPTLDLFIELGSIQQAGMREMLAAAWETNSLETLKIIFNARSISRGKGEKEAWTRGAAWLAETHPQTLLRNLECLVQPTDLIPKKRKAEDVLARDGEEVDADLCEVEEEVEISPATARSHGYYKDLLNLLVISSLPSPTTPSGSQLSLTGDFTIIPGFIVDPESSYAGARTKSKGKGKWSKGEVVDFGLTTAEKKVHDATRLSQLLSTTDGFHRALHLTVARIFGLRLQQDLATLKLATELRAADKEDETRLVEKKISLAAKWAPTEGAFHDKHTRITSTLAEFLTLSETRSPASLLRALTLYRSTYLAPLRNHLEVVERRMSANDWTNIKYSRVPSIAMNKNKKRFYRHDAEGFSSYLVRVAEGKSTISGAALTPASLASQAHHGSGVSLAVVEAQWKTLVQSIKDAGTLSNCIGVADVSGSMTYPPLADGTTPMDSALALAILIAQVTEPPFGNAVISFTDRPHFIDLTGSTLKDHIWQIHSQGMGFSTDFVLMMRTVLARAVENKLAPEQMIKRVFVFSDMEFDMAGCPSSPYATHHEIIKKEFAAAGYALPEMVYWNLAARPARNSKPVTTNEQGTALVSGYSAARSRSSWTEQNLRKWARHRSGRRWERMARRSW